MVLLSLALHAEEIESTSVTAAAFEAGLRGAVRGTWSALRIGYYLHAGA